MQTFSISFLGTWFFGQILYLLILLLLPGRKGYLRRSRTATWSDLSPDQAWDVLAQRLINERFVVADFPGDKPHRLDATRPVIPSSEFPGFPSTFAHALLPITAHADIAQSAVESSSTVAIDLKINRFVLGDTGESRHLDQLLDRVIDLTRSPAAPSTPTPLTLMSLSYALTALLASFLPLFWPLLSGKRRSGFAIGLACAVVGIITMAIVARRAGLNSNDHRGRWLLSLTFSVLFLAIVAIAALFLRFGPFAKLE
jgi:hypothetical protein